ncbi:CASP-like protein 1 [Pyrus ussuriensis x Pyrus communis]|uniref:CASP-like protein n=1 Tax=Pyrus ussuriensis x Pyrus communis TaxID=2448454 RepID=A0A5N5HB59_9ROSA|nr:CASP-like protein 1 [Pyrus ussuriensis x Pyrus communis]
MNVYNSFVLAKYVTKLILGIIASATGTAGSVAYILLRGNEEFRWPDSCYAYNKFCRHIRVSVVASTLLVLLLWTSVITLYKRISSKLISPPPSSQLVPETPN